MRYIKEILKKNRIWVLVYIGLGIFNAFMANYKADYFQKVIDGLADRTLAFAGVILDLKNFRNRYNNHKMYRFIKQNITRNIQNNTIRDINSCVATIIE